ncbi:MAG: response regulator [Candidatus Taylorbacteria bacterium]|nr:response regulator [Candidatus Taylorbacteria bacterium]
MRRILIVEDTQSIFELIRVGVVEMLPDQQAHFELVHVCTGEEALDLLGKKNQETVHGLLVGRYNPNDDGLKVIEACRAMHPEARIGLLSGEVSWEYHYDAIRSGANIVIGKPFEWRQIEAFLLQILYKNG